MAVTNHPSLEILRDADPRIIDAVACDTQDHFATELTEVNPPFMLRLLGQAKDYLTRHIGPDQAYIEGVRDGLTIRDRLQPDETFAILEAALEEPAISPVETEVPAKRGRVSSWLGLKALKYALATGVLSSAVAQRNHTKDSDTFI